MGLLQHISGRKPSMAWCVNQPPGRSRKFDENSDDQPLGMKRSFRPHWAHHGPRRREATAGSPDRRARTHTPSAIPAIHPDRVVAQGEMRSGTTVTEPRWQWTQGQEATRERPNADISLDALSDNSDDNA